MTENLGTFIATRDNDGTIIFKPLHAARQATLPVFYFSQWDKPGTINAIHVDADARRGDCGPAALTGLVHYLTDYTPTVDEVADACQQPKTGSGSYWTGHSHLKRGAAHYGITLQSRSEYKNSPLTPGIILDELLANRPVIALINYKTLRERVANIANAIKNQDSFLGAHWVLVVGYREHPTLGRCYEINDPDFWGIRRNDGDHRPIPAQAFADSLATVSQTATASYNYQGLIVID